MARDVVSNSGNAAGQNRKPKSWSAWMGGALALFALVMMLAAGCSSSSPQSESEVGTSELEVVETSSTTSTVQSEATPADVTTTAGGQGARPPSAAAQPEQAPAQDSQPRVTSAPTTQYVPPTTQYVCVPDSSAMSGLESDYRYNQYLYSHALSDLARRNMFDSGLMVRLAAEQSENAAEYERARGAINSCQDTYWYFLPY